MARYDVISQCGNRTTMLAENLTAEAAVEILALLLSAMGGDLYIRETWK